MTSLHTPTGAAVADAPPLMTTDQSMSETTHRRTPRHGPWTGPTALDHDIPVHCYFDWLHTAGHDEEDENGHVSNIAYVRWVQDSCRAHSEFLGLDRAAFEKLGGTFIVKRHELEYRAGCKAGDRVVVTSSVEEIRIASSIRRTRVIRLDDGVELLRARTEWVYVSLDGHRPKRIPPEVMVAFELIGKLARGRREREAV